MHALTSELLRPVARSSAPRVAAPVAAQGGTLTMTRSFEDMVKDLIWNTQKLKDVIGTQADELRAVRQENEQLKDLLREREWENARLAAELGQVAASPEVRASLAAAIDSQREQLLSAVSASESRPWTPQRTSPQVAPSPSLFPGDVKLSPAEMLRQREEAAAAKYSQRLAAQQTAHRKAAAQRAAEKAEAEREVERAAGARAAERAQAARQEAERQAREQLARQEAERESAEQEVAARRAAEADRRAFARAAEAKAAAEARALAEVKAHTEAKAAAEAKAAEAKAAAESKAAAEAKALAEAKAAAEAHAFAEAQAFVEAEGAAETNAAAEAHALAEATAAAETKAALSKSLEASRSLSKPLEASRVVRRGSQEMGASLTTPSGFAAFLSHYKVEAATEARWMQQELETALGERIFLDSDDLNNLSRLQDHVRDSRCLLLLQTRNVLTRPW